MPGHRWKEGSGDGEEEERGETGNMGKDGKDSNRLGHRRSKMKGRKRKRRQQAENNSRRNQIGKNSTKTALEEVANSCIIKLNVFSWKNSNCSI